MMASSHMYSKYRRRHQSHLVVKLFCIISTFVVALNFLALYKYIDTKFNNNNVNEIDIIHHNKHKNTTSKHYDEEDIKVYNNNNKNNRNKNDINKKDIPILHLVRDVSDTAVIFQAFSYRTRKLLNATNNDSKDTESKKSSEIDIGDYPPDLFTAEQRRQGYITLHIIGVLYMFLALAIVCDEFFVPALHVISSILKISDDVAGATFMAAGGSAPELFTSIIGVFFSDTQVGFGTIVGSAVFNVLFVIGMCAMFSKTLLHLTWWPLLRDSFFYIVALLLLIGFFGDKRIAWYEALCLFLVYIAYVIFMMLNGRIETKVKWYLSKRMKSSSSVTPLEEKNSQAFLAFPTVFAKNTFRHGAIQLVMHTLDPIAEVAIENKFQQMKDHYDSMSNSTPKDVTSSLLDEKDLEENLSQNLSPFHSQTTMLDSQTHSATDMMLTDKNTFEMQEQKYSNKNNNMLLTTHENGKVPNGDNHRKTILESDKNTKNNLEEEDYRCHQNEDELENNETRKTSETELRESKHNADGRENSFTSDPQQDEQHKVDARIGSHVSLRNSVRFSRRLSRCSSRTSCRSHRGLAPAKNDHHDEDDKHDLENPESTEENGEEDEDGPVDLSWPDTCFERFYYIVKAPLLFAMVITLPDVRRPSMRKLYPLSFIMSILWIAVFSYLMLWWASEIGRTAGIDVEIMGLTFIAAGTSIPDLITSVVVARQGLGDMAVSSSIGSNIFDVTVGLPLPWLAFSISQNFKDVIVNSSGLFCSTIMLFIMLIAVVITIALNKWRMTRLLGLTMFGLYIVFIAITLLLQLKVITCSV